jgi:hypothetical protein
MSFTTVYYPKTLDANWPAARAKNFVRALNITPGKNYAQNMMILATKASITVEELNAMNPVRYAEKNGINCKELLGHRTFNHFYWKNDSDDSAAPVAAPVAAPSAPAVVSAPPAAPPAAPPSAPVVAPNASAAAPAVFAPIAPAEAKDVCTLRMTHNTMQELEPYYRNVKLPPGTYYIGDLCYVLGDSWIYKKAWDAIDYAVPAFFRSDSGCIVIDRTAHGDGCYSDIDNRFYSVDAGVISIVSIELIENHLKYLRTLHNRNTTKPYTMKRLTDGGHVFTFQEEVTINFSKGLFRVWSGDTRVWIDTNPSDDDIYEDEE